MAKKKFKKLDSHEIDNICESLMDSVKSNSVDQQNHLLNILEKDCKNYLASFSVVGDDDDDLQELTDESGIWWFKQEFHNYVDNHGMTRHYDIGAASNALSAVFEIKRLLEEKDDLGKEFDSLLTDALSKFEKYHNKARLKASEALSTFNKINNLTKGRKASKRARAIFELYLQYLEKDPEVSHDILVKRITLELNKKNSIEIKFPDDEIYFVKLNHREEDHPFIEKDFKTGRVKDPKKSTLYTEYYLPIKKHLASKKH